LRANACAAAARLATARLAGAAVASIFGSTGAIGSAQTVAARAAAGNGSGATGGTLGIAARAQPQVSAFTPANLSKNATNPLAIAALGAAIILLGLAALPRTAIPDPRLTDMIVRHRAEVVMAGAAAFVAAVLALTFS
jgi:hypothetical protein